MKEIIDKYLTEGNRKKVRKEIIDILKNNNFSMIDNDTFQRNEYKVLFLNHNVKIVKNNKTIYFKNLNDVDLEEFLNLEK